MRTSITKQSLAVVLAGGVFLLGVTAAHASVDATSQAIVRDSGLAMGVAVLKTLHVMRIDAQVTASGLTGTQTQWAAFGSPQFAEYVQLPPIEADDGYDGHVFWNRDQTGLVWNDGSDAGLSTEINAAYLAGYGLWMPDADGANVSYRGVTNDKNGAYDALEVLPPGSKVPIELWFDRRAHLLEREVQSVGPIVTTVSLSNYRVVSGLLYPFKVHVDTTTGNNSDTTVTAVAFDPQGAAAQLERPATTVKDFAIDDGAATTTLPFDLTDNHVYVDVMLNGKGPYHMMFDTGGSNIVDPAVAKEIGALGQGSVQAGGVGAKTETFSFAKVRTLQVGAAVLSDQLFSIAPVRKGFGVSAGKPADGLIGWEVLARFVTTFDYANKRLELAIPGTPLPTAAHIVPFVFNGMQPQIDCEIDGIPSECTIDTGARDTMEFYAPYVAAHPQVKPGALTANGITGFGVGGPAYGRLGRLADFSIGGMHLPDLIAGFSSSTQGAFASPFTAANLGGGLLRRFNVTFDYAHENMAFVPNSDFATRDSYERSGLFVIDAAGKITVVDVRPGTPAARAGIVKGDVITGIDGAPAAMTLEQVRKYFSAAAGTVVKLRIAGKTGSARTVSMTLRDYV